MACILMVASFVLADKIQNKRQAKKMLKQANEIDRAERLQLEGRQDEKAQLEGRQRHVVTRTESGTVVEFDDENGHADPPPPYYDEKSAAVGASPRYSTTIGRGEVGR